MRKKFARAIRSGIICARDTQWGDWGIHGWAMVNGRTGQAALAAFVRERARMARKPASSGEVR